MKAQYIKYITWVTTNWKMIAFIIGLPSLITGYIIIHDKNVVEKYKIEQREAERWDRVFSYIENDSTVKIRLLKSHVRDSIDLTMSIGEMKAVKQSLTDYWTAKKEFDQVINFQQDLLNTMNEIKKNSFQEIQY